MRKIVKNAAAGAVLGGSLLFTAGLGIASAQPVGAPDGLVNLSVGETTILEAVSTEEAATKSAAICGTEAADVSALVEQVDREGSQQTVCAGLPGGDLVVAQNAATSDAPEVADSSEGAQSPEGAETTEPAPGQAG